MQITSYSFQDLPLSELFQAYNCNYDSLSEFFNGDPHDINSLAKQAQNVNYRYPRSELVTCLKEFNKQFEESDRLLQNIERFADEDSVAIVTGQQLNMLGGPTMIVYKTLTAILQARELEKKLGSPVVPVFWLGDEDHDYEEIQDVVALTRDSYRKFSFDPPDEAPHAVADMQLNGQIEDFKNEISEYLYDTDFSDTLWQLIDRCYKPGKSFVYAFGSFMAQMFAKHGIVLAGSNTTLIKDHIKEGLITAVEERKQVEENLAHQSKKIDDKYHQQVKLSGSNLFYLDPDAGRMKINLNGERWHTDNGNTWSTEELTQHITDHPERFSPNVFLRPVLQDFLLPTAGYVAGPGEVAYYAQMKEVYPVFDLSMPIIVPRFNATIIESAIDRILKKLPFELHEYQQRIEDLETRYVKQKDAVNLDRLFGEWKQHIQELSDEKAEIVAGIDPTLKKSVGSAKAVYFGELDKLQGKLHRSMKQSEKLQLDRIAKIKDQIFPEDTLQERVVSSIYFMNKYGVDVWDRLLENMEMGQLPRHNLIYL